MAKQAEVRRRKSLRTARRKAIKTTGIIASTGILFNKWQAPVVDSIILPAHAQTTDSTGSAGSPTPQTRSYWGYKLTATGVNGINPPLVTVCAEESNGMATITLQGDSNIGRRRGTIPTDGTQGDAAVVSVSPDACEVPQTRQISVLAISDTSITIAFRDAPSGDGYNVTVNAGSCGSFDATDNVCKKKAKKKVASINNYRRYSNLT